MIQIYQITPTIKKLTSWKSHKMPVMCMRFDKSSTLLAAGSSDGQIMVYDVKKGYATHSFDSHQSKITKFQFELRKEMNKMDFFLYSSSQDGTVMIWDLNKSKQSRVLKNHYEIVTDFIIRKDSKKNVILLFSVSKDKVVSMWDLNDQNSKPSTILIFDEIISIQYFPPTEKYNSETMILLGFKNGKTSIYDYKTKKEIISFQLDFIEDLYKLDYIPSLSTFMLVSEGNILFTDIDFNPKKLLVGNNDEILDLKYLDQNRLAVSNNTEHIRIFERDSRSWKFLSGHKKLVLSISSTKKGNLLASSSKDSTVRIWDTKSSKCVAIFQGHASSVSAVCISKNGEFAISGSEDKTLKYWDLSKQKKVSLKINGEKFNVVESIEISTAKWTVVGHNKEVNSIDISPNDKIFATGSADKTVKIWSSSNASLLSILSGHKKGVWDVKFSPTEKCIASCSADKTIKIWSLTDYSCMRTLEGHQTSVLRIHYTTLGLQLISSDTSGVLKLWTIRNSECMKTFEAHGSEIWAITTTPSSVTSEKDFRLFTASVDGVFIWKDVTQSKEEEEKIKQEELVLQEQDLSNKLRKKDFNSAFLLALKMEKPYQLFQILKSIQNTSANPQKEIDSIVSKFSLQELSKSFEFLQIWNTSNRNAFISQNFLNSIVRIHHPETLINMKDSKNVIFFFFFYFNIFLFLIFFYFNFFLFFSCWNLLLFILNVTLIELTKCFRTLLFLITH